MVGNALGQSTPTCKGFSFGNGDGKRLPTENGSRATLELVPCRGGRQQPLEARGELCQELGGKGSWRWGLAGLVGPGETFRGKKGTKTQL